jgi:heme exporter protein A
LSAFGGDLKLCVEQLRVARGDRVIVDDLSFMVSAGEALLLTGANGAGKTTLLRALSGLMPKAGGTVRLEDGAADTDVGEQCHFIGHLNGLKSGLSAAENLAFWANYLGGAGGLTVRDALAQFELSALADIPAGGLSAGQKRRLGLARLLVVYRPVWLLDEPTVSLDAQSVGLLAGVIEAHLAGGGIVIAATHLPLGLAKTRELRLAVVQAEAEDAL